LEPGAGRLTEPGPHLGSHLSTHHAILSHGTDNPVRRCRRTRKLMRLSDLPVIVGDVPPTARADLSDLHDQAATDPAMVSARGLRKAYGAFTAVDGIDVEVRRGEAFGFLGPNGAGKSS